MPEYRLLSDSGKDLGPFRAGTTWEAGDQIFLGRDLFEVVDLTEPPNGEDVDAYLIVRPS